jgi:hypothetical protein
MEERKFIQKLLAMSEKYEVTRYDSHSHFAETHAAFEGTPKKHPRDENVLILLTNPFVKNNSFYEFPRHAIGTVEELGTVTSEDGDSAVKIRVWVKKGMPGLKSEPFIVK